VRIAGFVGRGGIEDLQRMNAASPSRPDGDGTWVDASNRVFLGRRLSILDIGGGISRCDAGRSARRDLQRRDLQPPRASRTRHLGCVFQSDHSDTEVLLHGYRCWARIHEPAERHGRS
jgi:asparagine synthase (glutamine-hydrolysing)